MPCTTYLPLLLLLFLLPPPSVQSKVIIKGNQTILSFKAIFRLGFFSTTNGSSNWYLGISYASMPTPTHVWVANRIRPVSDPDSSTLELTSTGYLIVSNLRDGVVWQTDNKQPGTDFRFSETGNLILINDDGSPVWQSFDNPTDTWLPGMNVTGLTAMTSWRSLFDPSPGFYSLRLSPSFNEFQLVYKGTTPYWSTGNWTGEAFVGVPEMTIPYIYRFHFVNPYTPTASFWYIVPPLDSVSEPRLTRFMVGANGQLKQYTWDPQTQSWNMFWLQPEDPCRVYNLCGQLGFCSSELLKPCACIRGFRPRNDAAWRSDDYSDGCRRENGDSGEKSDTFEAVGDLRYDGDVKMSRLQVSKSSCAKTCLGNSSCVGFYHKEKSNLCKILLESPNNLKNSSSWTGVSEDVLYIREPKKGNSKGNISKSIIILCSVVGSISVLGFTLLVPLILLKRSRKRKKTRKQDEDGFAVLNLKVFSFKELQSATNGFSDKVGHGGFGAVFKGTLPGSSTFVAVKRLERPGSGESEFRAEVCTIGNIQHVNLVRLRGFCSENLHRLLVYDYMPQGSLSSYLSRTSPKLLSWETRFRIALGTAKGIAYLHEGCRDCIIHCDIKPENILLDSDYNAKVSDFGLAKLLGRDFSRVLATMRGTWGYVAPEWISGLPITTKADVYSFGMTLLELIGGRRNVIVNSDTLGEKETEPEKWAMGSDEEDFVFHGTPIEREEEIASRKKKAVAGASGNLRTLPAWKQEVTDEEGRRRFHGAFTGGYSAGYYNTVGSKEGWAPQSFTSSRQNRAGARKQSISDFLDEDEKADMEGKSLSASSQFDTFGFTAAEHSRKHAEKEQHERPSAIPGPVPDELVAPVSESIGVKLLLKMGWRRGHSIKEVRASSDARREARKAFLAFYTDENTKETPDSLVSETEVETSLGEDIKISESTPVYVLNPKQDLHGLGYDPFKHAPEFREKKRSRMSANKEVGFRKPLSMKESLFGPKSGKIAPGFGIGALEELDVEDEDVYAGYDFDQTYVIEDEQPARQSNDNRLRLTSKEHDVLPGFGAAKNSDYSMERFNPPIIPKDFVARHKFSGPLEAETKPTVSAPPEVPPPADNNLKLLIEGFATFVSRCGKLYEDLSREKNQSNQLFDFLREGNGHDYYARRLWEEQQKRKDQSKLTLDVKVSPTVQKMTAETRGSLLGEKPLQRSLKETDTSASSGGSFQFPTNLSDTFTKSASSQEAADAVKPFKDDPAKQERFEQFLKEKYKGGLRTTDSNRVNSMSESARAQERLDFEAAAEAIEKGKAYKEVRRATEQPLDFLAGGLQFTSGGTEQIKDTGVVDMKSSKTYPKREEFQWRPSPLLCKRFDLPDPFMGKLPPAPRARNKMDSLVFLPDTVKAASARQVSESQVPKKETSIEEPEVEVEVENVERPVDLYKAIFSDDSEDDEDQPMNGKIQEGQEKKNEAAATTLNRLIAGDFLESLGKELGFEVPMEEEIKSRSKPEDSSDKRLDRPGLKEKVEEKTSSLTLGSEEEKSRKKREKSPGKRSGGNDLSSSESSGDERRRKRYNKKDRHRNDSESDSSSDYHSRDKQGSRSRSKRRESSREKRSSHKKHSKHRRTKKSSSSRYSSDEEQKESRREKKRRRD